MLKVALSFTYLSGSALSSPLYCSLLFIHSFITVCSFFTRFLKATLSSFVSYSPLFFHLFLTSLFLTALFNVSHRTPSSAAREIGEQSETTSRVRCNVCSALFLPIFPASSNYSKELYYRPFFELVFVCFSSFSFQFTLSLLVMFFFSNLYF